MLRNKRRAAQWLPGVCAIVVALTISACATEPDEAALRRALDEMETALESGKTGDFVDYVTEDFSANSATLDARQLRATLVGLALRHEKIGITVSSVEITLFGDRATIKVQVLATGGSWMPQTGQVLDIESSWRRVDGDWKCFAASWTGKW